MQEYIVTIFENHENSQFTTIDIRKLGGARVQEDQRCTIDQAKNRLARLIRIVDHS